MVRAWSPETRTPYETNQARWSIRAVNQHVRAYEHTYLVWNNHTHKVGTLNSYTHTSRVRGYCLRCSFNIVTMQRMGFHLYPRRKLYQLTLTSIPELATKCRSVVPRTFSWSPRRPPGEGGGGLYTMVP